MKNEMKNFFVPSVHMPVLLPTSTSLPLFTEVMDEIRSEG